MRAVDANVLLRLVTRDDKAQVAAAEAFVARGAWVSQLVLMEAVWVLDSVYELDTERLARAIDMLLEHKELTIDDSDSVRDALSPAGSRPAAGPATALRTLQTFEPALRDAKIDLSKTFTNEFVKKANAKYK